YVFEKGPDLWVETAQLLPNQYDGTTGVSVAMDADTILLGFDQFDGQHVDSGAVAVFERSAGTWLQTDWLTPNQTAMDDWFGREMAIDGDRLVVTAPGDDTVTGPGTGSAHVYERQGSVWTKTAKLVPADATDFARFGESVDLSQNDILVGSPYHGLWDNLVGSAYVFSLSGEGWFQRPMLLASDGLHNHSFGRGVALAEGQAWIGNPSDHEAAFNAGAIYRFGIPSYATPFCSCHTDSPCGNAGRREGCVNSSGFSGILSACASSSVASDDLTLTLSRMAPHQSVVLFYGASEQRQPFGDGLLCVAPGAGGLFRFPPRASTAQGHAVFGPGLIAEAALLSNSSALTPGSTRHVQGWYRDPVGPCGSGYNLSNALSIVFTP
ncbi:MAG: hypothetical protein AB8H79_15100, partial [Myxococcota bacterium]